MKQNGFTLVELLVVLAIGGLLLTGLTTVIAGFGDNLENSVRIDRKAVATARLARLKIMLEGALYNDETGNPLPQLQKRLRLRIPSPQSVAFTGWHNFSIETGNGPGGALLVLADTQAGSDLPDSVIIDGVRDIKFTVRREKTELGEEAEIREIILDLSLSDGREYRVGAAPRITVSGACVFDPISQECRQ